MNSEQITINFSSDGEEAAIIVRRTGDKLGLAVSLEKEADVEVYLAPKDILALLNAIQHVHDSLESQA